MIDPTQLPILLQAIEFVFDEGRKILEERRERRKAQEKQAVPPQVEAQAPAQAVAAPAVPEKQQTKEELLKAKIDEIRWQNHEADVQHLVRLLEIHSRNYQLAKEQHAKWGSALVPPIIVNNLTEAENSVSETVKQLEAVLSKVYEKEIHLPQ